ncbi:phosphotransferase [Streptomyces sp. NPDC046853]|uniref:maltokinase N-terminal cap-like domain-containing protein n=1 Tax=Streptomyces sp. NPDC046853 TaxID=3154920 RepID=UPI0033F9010E
MLETATQSRGSLTPTTLLTSLDGVLQEWLPKQRWFAGKGLPITELTVVSMTELHPGCMHLLIRSRHTGTRDGCYQLLLGVDEDPPPRLQRAVIGRPSQGPLQGLTVYDALHDPRSAALLLERLRTPGAAGPLRFERDGQTEVPSGLTPRVLDGEQSNTSLVYGDSFILKIFRRIQYGINPDLEVPWALGREGCSRVPAPVAWFWTAEPRRTTLGVLQPFLRDATDGWTMALQALASGDDFTDESYELGRATAEVHLALAQVFAPDLPDRQGGHRLASAMITRLEATARQVPALVPYMARLKAAYGVLGARVPGQPDQRIHGDLHLGQVLWAGQRWFVIDFEGEPARPIAERRHTQAPVRDIAGMLRSFEYAAHATRPWQPQWAQRCREAYCAGYAAESAWDPRKQGALLRAYETDRAVYEALYEARHRPDWLPVPMAAIDRLAKGT